ncbi:MAG: hypothetical protein LBL15_04970 [Oscillospiraceae bacterium]|jgi:hypothetical protein|nr:hypothetical protein [Oscillospiraceae bacterium]
MEPAYNEFTFGESVRILKMAFPRYFRSHTLNAQSGETAALLALLEKGCIKCGSIGFRPEKNPSARILAEAERLAEVLHKSSYIRAFRKVLHIFSGYWIDLLKTKNGALYYPELKLFVCVGYLTPKALLSLFAEPDCEQVAIFTAMAKWGRRNHYLLFRRGAAWEEFRRFLAGVAPSLAAAAAPRDSKTKM